MKVASKKKKIPKSKLNLPKVPRPFDVGDLVTGKDRSYKRSIYKMVSTTENPIMGLFEFQSLGDSVVEMYKDKGVSKSQYTFPREYADFRPATRKELTESNRVQVVYRLLRLLKKLGIATYI
jgi:hypothetical protein